jgi:hypothetical protein
MAETKDHTTVDPMCDQTQEDLDALDYETTKGAKLIVEVIADSSGKYCSNGKRFSDTKEALAYAKDLAWRWTLVQKFRIAKDI